MRIVTASPAGSSNARSIQAPHTVRGNAQQGKNKYEKIREQEREREQKIQETENKRIGELQKKIMKIAEAPAKTEEEQELKQLQIAGLSEDIQQIYQNRAEREQMAMEREMERQKQEVEEKRQEQEKINKANNPVQETPEEAIQRENTKGLVELSLSMEGIRAYKQTQSRMEAEATQLQNDIESDVNPVFIGESGLGVTVMVKTGYTDLNDFRNQQLLQLNKGIAGLDATMRRAVYSMNQTSREWAERNNEIRTDDKTTESPDENKPDGADKAGQSKADSSADTSSSNTDGSMDNPNTNADSSADDSNASADGSMDN